MFASTSGLLSCLVSVVADVVDTCLVSDDIDDSSCSGVSGGAVTDVAGVVDED